MNNRGWLMKWNENEKMNETKEFFFESHWIFAHPFHSPFPWSLSKDFIALHCVVDSNDKVKNDEKKTEIKTSEYWTNMRI